MGAVRGGGGSLLIASIISEIGSKVLKSKEWERKWRCDTTVGVRDPLREWENEPTGGRHVNVNPKAPLRCMISNGDQSF